MSAVGAWKIPNQVSNKVDGYGNSLRPRETEIMGHYCLLVSTSNFVGLFGFERCCLSLMFYSWFIVLFEFMIQVFNGEMLGISGKHHKSLLLIFTRGLSFFGTRDVFMLFNDMSLLDWSKMRGA